MTLPTPSAAAPPRADVPTLVLRIDLVAGRLECDGALTRCNARMLHAAVAGLLRADAELWLLDVTGLTACDRFGLRAIGAAYRRALGNGRRMTLAGASPALQGSLARLRLDRHLIDDRAAHGDGGRP